MAGKKGQGKGRKASAAHRAALSAGLKKMYAKMTVAQRRKHLAPAHDSLRDGKAWTEARRKEQGDRLRGKKLTPEHRAKVAAGLRRYHAKRRKAAKKK